MMAPAVVSVECLEPYVVRVVFADAEVRDVDVEPLLDGPVFHELRNPEKFAQVVVDELTGAVVWPGGADLDPDVMLRPRKSRLRGLPLHKPSDVELVVRLLARAG